MNILQGLDILYLAAAVLLLVIAILIYPLLKNGKSR